MPASTIERSLQILVENCDRLEEDLFLKKIAELAATDRAAAVNWLLRRLLAAGGTFLQQVRLLAALGELRVEEATPVVVCFLQAERPVRVYRRGVRLLRQLASREAYKALAAMVRQESSADRLRVVGEEFAELLAGNRLFFCFDIFFRERSDARGIAAAMEFLVAELPDEWLEEMLPLTRSRHPKIRLAVLHLFGRRGFAPALAEFLDQLQGGVLARPGPHCKPFLEAFTCQALFLGDAAPLANRLQQLTVGVAGTERSALQIQLARLHPARFLPELQSRYGELSLAERLELVTGLPQGDPDGCREFMRHLLRHEDQPQLLAEVVRRLLAWRDYDFLFALAGGERRARRKTILEIVFDTDPEGLEPYAARLLRPDEEDVVLCHALAYVLKRNPAAAVEPVLELFFAGVGVDVKQTIVRHLRCFAPCELQRFLERALTEPAGMLPYANDLLIGLLPVMSNPQLQPAQRDWLLNRLLVLLEEAAPNQLAPFVFFFERFAPRSRQEAELIAAELKLAQQVLARYGDENRLAPRIHLLAGKLGRGRW